MTAKVSNSEKSESLPVVDSQSFRKEQMERFTNSIGEMGDYAKEMKRSTKWNTWLGILMTILVLLVISIALWRGGGLSGFMDLEASARSFNCTSMEHNDTVRIYSDAHTFQKMYGGECVLLKKGVRA